MKSLTPTTCTQCPAEEPRCTVDLNMLTKGDVVRIANGMVYYLTHSRDEEHALER